MRGRGDATGACFGGTGYLDRRQFMRFMRVTEQEFCVPLLAVLVRFRSASQSGENHRLAATFRVPFEASLGALHIRV